MILPQPKTSIPVQFRKEARDDLAEALKNNEVAVADLINTFEGELSDVILRAELDGQARKPAEIEVSRVLFGFVVNPDKRAILVVKIRYGALQYKSHIIKLGTSSEILKDYTGWKQCVEARHVLGKIFTRVSLHELGEDQSRDGMEERLADDPKKRCAVIYEDAMAFYGPKAKERVALLEDAIRGKNFSPALDVDDVGRAFVLVTHDLGNFLYHGSTCDEKAADEYYRWRLDFDKDRGVIPRWENSHKGIELRQQAIWVLYGGDAPDANFQEITYLDPIDFVRWTIRKGKIPKTLIGMSHGDLHFRNIMIGIEFGILLNPAVFDYGDMKAGNVLAWDFVKPEIELKVRMLAELLKTDEDALRTLLRRQPQLCKRHKINPDGPIDKHRKTAARLIACLAFEEHLNSLTDELEQYASSSENRRIPEPETGCEQLDRLVKIILNVRERASYWLGINHLEHEDWKSDYFFALGVYGILNIRWKYLPDERLSALVSSGVALAHMAKETDLMQQSYDGGWQREMSYEDFPTHRIPFLILHDFWEKGEHLVANHRVCTHLLTQKGPDQSTSPHTLKDSVKHAIPLIGQAVLARIESKAPMESLQHIFEELTEGDAAKMGYSELFGRRGRGYKDSADVFWVEAGGGSKKPTDASRSQYLTAFNWYLAGYKASNDHYVGVNVATLAFLLDDPEASIYAREVLKLCEIEEKDLTLKGIQSYWLYATMGEAAIIAATDSDSVEDDKEPSRYYQLAMKELKGSTASQNKKNTMAESSYKQLCRLWKVLCERVEPALLVYERSSFGAELKHKFPDRTFLEKPQRNLTAKVSINKVNLDR